MTQNTGFWLVARAVKLVMNIDENIISYAYLSNVKKKKKKTSNLHIFKVDLITSTWPIYMT